MAEDASQGREDTLPLRWIRCRPVVAEGSPASPSVPPAAAQAVAAPGPFDGLPEQLLLSVGQAPLRLTLEAPPCRWLLLGPDHTVEPSPARPQRIGLWRCRLRMPAATTPPAPCDPVPQGREPRAWEALIGLTMPPSAASWPPPTGRLELLVAAPAAPPADAVLELGVEPRRCRLLDPRQLRGRLLEFLKFRVLAAQEEFFNAFHEPAALPMQRSPAGAADSAATDAIARFRAWLLPLWPDGRHLTDADLQHCLEQAHRLYVN